VTTRTPLQPRRDAVKDAADLGSAPSGIFFANRLDEANHVEAAREIDVCAHAI
jgi:hypothetical protein